MYVYANSNDCLEFFPDNKPSHFHIKLPLAISSKKYSKCALIELSFPSLMKSHVENIYVLTNFIVESYVGYRKLPVIYRTLIGSQNTYDLISGRQYYVKLKNIETDILEVQLIDGSTLNEIELLPGSIHCTFHFLDVE